MQNSLTTLFLTLTLLIIACPKRDVSPVTLPNFELELKDKEKIIAEKEAALTACLNHVDALTAETAALCANMEELQHAGEMVFFDLGKTSIPLPCDMGIGEFTIRLHEIDLKNEWAYLKYNINGQVRFSDNLEYGGNGKFDRGTIRPLDSTFSESLYITVESCTSSTMCKMSCRVVSDVHLSGVCE